MTLNSFHSFIHIYILGLAASLVHLPLEHPLGVHELAVHLSTARHHGEQHGDHHGLLVQMFIIRSLLEGCF